MPIRVFPHRPLIPRAFELAGGLSLTLYAAVYLALALDRSAGLFSAYKTLVGLAQGERRTRIRLTRFLGADIFCLRDQGLSQGTRMNRWADWWEQAKRDLEHARHALDDRDFEWAAFAAQQAAEKALKALIMSRGGEPWGHSLTALTEALQGESEGSPGLVEAANRLDKHYIPARYPNGFASGYPGKLYTQGEAEGAIADAAFILEICRCRLPGQE